MSDILTLTELAARLRVSERTVYRMLDDGCPSMLVGRRRRFHLPTVIEWTQDREPLCQSEKTRKANGTPKSVSMGNAFTDASRRVHLRVMPSS
jgi:excisionase family DNA binding protein